MDVVSEEVEFNARLLRNNQIQIPKRIVEDLWLWVGTRVRVRVWTGHQIVDFKTTIRKRFRFTIPRLELARDPVKSGDIVKVRLTKLEPPKT